MNNGGTYLKTNITGTNKQRNMKGETKASK